MHEQGKESCIHQIAQRTPATGGDPGRPPQGGGGAAVCTDPYYGRLTGKTRGGRIGTHTSYPSTPGFGPLAIRYERVTAFVIRTLFGM